ncbi:MAG: DsrE family protein [Phycisphaerae bacterium]|nr:DsrE family protein [Phycisphaerae bacterium]
MKTVLVINRYGMGEGDDTLARELLTTFLNKASTLRDLEAICLYNGGVKAAFEGSPMLPALSTLHENGVELITCGTCVNHFASAEKVKVGRVGSMDDVLSTLHKAKKVITL